MKKAKYAINKNKYLLEPEVEQLNQVLEKNKLGSMGESTQFRDTTLLWFLLHTGARASEALNVKKIDLNYHERTVFIEGLKDSNDREIPLPKWLFDRVAALAQNDGSVFGISYSRLVQIWEKYRPAKKKLHSLRHTFAIGLYKRTKDIRLVQVALGHRNITNTMVYADYVYNQEELRKMIVG